MAGIGAVSNALGWLFWSLAAIAVALRLWASRKRGDYLRLDDYVMSFSLLLNFFGVAFNSVAIHYGLGQHIRDLVSTPEVIPKAGLWAVVSDSFCLFGDVVPKFAVALLVNRILAPCPLMRTFHVALTLTLLAFTVAVFLVSILQCHPVAHQWNPDGVPGSCLNPKIFERIGIAEGALGSFVDLYFSVYPPIIISQLHMSLKKRIIAGITMSLGLFTLFTTLYKTAGVLPALQEAQADVTYILCQVVLWGLLESSVTIIAGSIPTWGWFFRTPAFQRLATWVSLHSLRFSSHERVTSQRDQDGVEMGNGQDKGDAASTPRKGGSDAAVVDSIVELERSAAW